MKLQANVSVGAVVRAMGLSQFDKAIIKSVRATVAYRLNDQDSILSFTRKGGERLLVENAEVDRQDAIDLLEEVGHNFDYEDYGSQIDDNDLEAFIAACADGDRDGALVFASRIFSETNRFTAERLILKRIAA